MDWFTIVAQIFNFLLLVGLLYWLLYGRIIKAMDARQAKIAARLDEAEKKRNDAEQEAAAYRQKGEALDAKREELLTKAREEAEAHRAELMKQARAEVDALEARWRESVERQRAAFLQELRQRAAKQTLAVARRALADLAGVELEARIIDAFVERIGSLPDDDWRALATPIRHADDEAPELVVRTVFDLPDARRQRIEQIVRARCGDGITVRFETAFDPLCGIELKGQGRKVAWTIESYLGSLEESLGEAFDQLPHRGKLRDERERDLERDETEREAEEEKSAVGTRQAAGGEKREEEHEHEEEGAKREEETGDEDERGNG